MQIHRNIPKIVTFTDHLAIRRDKVPKGNESSPSDREVKADEGSAVLDRRVCIESRGAATRREKNRRGTNENDDGDVR